MQSALLCQCDSSQELDGLVSAADDALGSAKRARGQLPDSQCVLRAQGDERGAAALERMQDAVQVLLRGVGEDIFREGLIDTPRVSWPLIRLQVLCRLYSCCGG